MITVNILSNLHRVILSAVTNKFNTVCNMALRSFTVRFWGVLLMSVFKGKKYWDIREWGRLDEVVWKYRQTEKLSIFFIVHFYFQ